MTPVQQLAAARERLATQKREALARAVAHLATIQARADAAAPAQHRAASRVARLRAQLDAQEMWNLAALTPEAA